MAKYSEIILSYKLTGRNKSSGPFCTWIRLFGLFGVLLAKYGVLILYHKLGNPRRSGHCALKHGFWSFGSNARQMRQNNLSHKLGESSRMGHSTPKQAFLGFSQSSWPNAANYLFPTNWAKRVEWAILHLNTAVFACRSLLGNCGKISFSHKLGESTRIKHSSFELGFLGLS